MKARLNEKKAEALKPKKTGYEVRDEVVRGLVLRVGKKGQKVWEVIIPKGSRRFRRRLGMYPALSVKDARIRAQEAKENARTYNAGSAVKSVADIFEGYKQTRSGEMRTWNDVQSVWDYWARDHIGKVRASDLSIHHGLDLRSHVSKESSPERAGAVIRYLRPIFAWAADEQIIDENPWANLKVGAIAKSRDRVLLESEWAAVWETAADMEYPFGPFMQALMLSAQRLSNVAQMRWDEIHGDVWVIPRDKVKATKKKRAAAHEVPLSKTLAALIAKQPRRGPFVFTTTGNKAIAPGSKLKTKLAKSSETSDWRFHDIRRTAATLMTTGNEKGKVSRFVVERVLGHAETSVTAVYDRSTYRDEKRAALEVLAATIAIRPKPQSNTGDAVRTLR